MDILEVKNIVSTSSTHNFKVISGIGSQKKRLFVSSCNNLCEFRKGSRKYGRVINQYEVEEWNSITPIREVDDVTKVRNFMRGVVGYLSESGLWDNIRGDYEFILSLPNDVFADLVNSSWTDQRDKLHKIAIDNGRESLSFHCDSIVYTAKKGIKNVNYDRHSKSSDMAYLEDAIRNKKSYRSNWRKGYDNSVEVNKNGDVLCGWYSEEYKGCANGHYYLLLDAKHAYYYETD